MPNGGIIFPNPNAPTARLLGLGEIERLLQTNADSVVVVDEAYIDFGGASAVGFVKQYPQLLVVHTLSKSHSLAGLRVGYAIGQADLIEALVRVKDSFNSYPLDRFAQAGAIAAMQDRAYLSALAASWMALQMTWTCFSTMPVPASAIPPGLLCNASKEEFTLAAAY